MIYDAENQVLGRLCSAIAKQLLKGEKVFVVNCEKAVIAGNPKFTIKKYFQKIHRGEPKHGPYFPKTPDGIFTRTARGMLPWDRTKGRKAFKNLRVFISLPEEFKDKKLERVKGADISKLKCKYISLSELSLALGGRKRW